LVVAVKENSLQITMNNIAKATLDHWHYDTFRGYYESRWWGQTAATFSIDATGKISTVVIEGMEFSKSE
jgi:hypothetical protein